MCVISEFGPEPLLFLPTPVHTNAFAMARGYRKIHFETPQAIIEKKKMSQPVYVRSFGSYVIHDAVPCALDLCAAGATAAVTASLVPLHVASHAESFTATFVGAQEWLLTRVRVAVDPQTGWARKSLVAHLTDVPILRRAGKVGRGRRRDVVVMLVLLLPLAAVVGIYWRSVLRVRD